MEHKFSYFLARLEQLVEGKGSALKTAPIFSARADNCIYVHLPGNPELQEIIKKETRAYIFREQLLNRKKVGFVVAASYKCDDFGCTGHYDNPDDEESGHVFRNRFPEDINGAYILFAEEKE